MKDGWRLHNQACRVTNQQDAYSLQNGTYNCIIELKSIGHAQSVVLYFRSVGSGGSLTELVTQQLI